MPQTHVSAYENDYVSKLRKMRLERAIQIADILDVYNLRDLLNDYQPNPNQKYLTAFSKGMRAIRIERGISGKDLAEMLGVTTSCISAYEKNNDTKSNRDVKKMNLENAIKIADILQLRDLRLLLDD